MSDLRADCARCEGLCCVVLAFEASHAFACTKPLDTACHYLAEDNRCQIHGARRELGFTGCDQFDCHGAGQRATALVPGRSWRDDPERRRALFATFCTLLEVHELLLLLDVAARVALPTWAATQREFLVQELEGVAATAQSAAPEMSRLRRTVSAFLRTLEPMIRRRQRRQLPVWRS